MRLLTATLALVLGMPQEKETDWSRYFPLANGNEWEYGVRKHGKENSERWKILGAEKRKGADCFRLQIESPVPSGPGGALQMEKRDLYLSSTKKGIEIIEAPTKHISEEERYFLRFPLEKGAKGSIYWSAPQEAEVEEKTEEITVPAGKFTCVVLKHRTSFPGTTASSRMWIAPDVGFVKTETVWKPEKGEASTDSRVLKKFTAGKK
jgi:hypothetical protein